MAGLKRNRVAHEYDRNRRRGALGGAGVDRAGRDDSVYFEADQLLSHFAYLFGLPLRPPVLDCDVSGQVEVLDGDTIRVALRVSDSSDLMPRNPSGTQCGRSRRAANKPENDDPRCVSTVLEPALTRL